MEGETEGHGYTYQGFKFLKAEAMEETRGLQSLRFKKALIHTTSCIKFQITNYLQMEPKISPTMD